ncbi:LysR family transcriptional regulator [Streptomyces sp. J2-1]|uniref:LysR family transcriptional regulator n=1 Tax=Streptomyces corallincola TaxID=2851888 RepID=UPI001C38C8F5|nr:LysR family transcriptional regulator [Streptomyces corallincola]MBV2353859.1 LysR family transcriptional regulator [Streptomyces corallincola]
MNRLETRDLVYFAEIAEELHFSKAAENLGISQPVLSRAIARLERRMGVRLLDRTSRRVELTEAGRTFRDECRHLLRGLDIAVRRTRRAADAPRLVVAVRPGTGSGLLTQVLSRYTGPEPELVFTHERAAAVRDGIADMALVCLGTEDISGLRGVEVGEELPMALLPVGHPLAGRSALGVADLVDEPGYRARCPEIGIDEIMDRVALGRLVTVVGSAASERLPRDVVAVPVTDLPPTTLAFCWSPTTRNPGLLDLVQRLAADETTGRLVRAA